MRSSLLIPLVTLAASLTGWADAAELKYKERLPADLAECVPGILKLYDAQTGHFGRGIWLCTDQDRMYALAVAYATAGSGNRFFKAPKLLAVIMKAGDALIDDMDRYGRWMFRKKDGSTWGMIWMPWTYSRWIRTYGLIRDDMPPDRRDAWTKALTLGYTGISKTGLGSIHNIATHHAMGLYAAGKALGRPEWCQQAGYFLMKVIAAQAEAGYWSEGGGPVVGYDFVYIDALGTYYAMSGDGRVLPALEKAARFHYYFTYPDGRNVETVDQRNPYHEKMAEGNVGFTFSPIGRAYLQRQWAHGESGALEPDLMASLLLYGEEGLLAPLSGDGKQQVFTLQEEGAERAAVVRRGPWFFCLSAYTTPVATSRWHQDRQNLVSIFHDQTGLILGGGNTKLQPLWSNFTVGDVNLLVHKPGDTNPNFLPPAGKLYHVPSHATLIQKPDLGLDLSYGPEQCRIRLRPLDDRTLQYRLEATTTSGMPVAAHLTLLPRLRKSLETGSGTKILITQQAADLTAEQVGGSVTYAGYRLKLPPTATLHWPRLPHNPYTKDGHAEPSEGRIVITIPFDAQHHEYNLTLEALP